MRWSGETYEQWLQRARTDGLRRYALLPRQMTDGTWVWLEHYWAVLEYGQRGDTWRYGLTAEKARTPWPPAPPPSGVGKPVWTGGGNK